MWIFLQFNQWKRLFFIPRGRGKKYTFKLFENTLMFCFQARAFSLVARKQFLLFVYLLLRMTVKLSLVDLNQKSDCTFFFSTSLLPAGNRTTNFDGISVVSCVRILNSVRKSSSSLSKLVGLVNDYWYKLEEVNICLWHPSWANFPATVKVCTRISSLFLKWIPSRIPHRVWDQNPI